MNMNEGSCRIRMVVSLAVVLTLAATGELVEGNVSTVVDAAKSRDWSGVQTLLDGGSDVNTTHGDGATALHWAAYWDNREAVLFLIEAGAAVNATNDLGVSPLWLACNNGSAPMVQTLLMAGADPNATLPSGETPLMTASRTGTLGVVKDLLMYGADVNATETSHGQNALMWAVAQKHSAVVEVLLSYGANVRTRSKVYPQVISSSGNADPIGVYEISQGGYTALLFAARHGDIASTKLLLASGSDANDTAPMGTSALLVATHSGHGEVAALLLAAGANPDAADAGYTPLHAAVLRGNLALVDALIAHGASPDQPMTRGTPGRRTSADWRLQHNLVGSTPYWLAARFREPQIMQKLAAAGADPDFTLNGTNAPMAAIAGTSTRGRRDAVVEPDEESHRTVESIKVALDLGVDVNATDEGGSTALHMAASRKLDPIVEYLATRGAKLDLRNKRGQTPLTLAMAGPGGPSFYLRGPDTSNTVEILIKLGATDKGEADEPADSEWR